MTVEEPRWLLGLKSAGRSLLPLAVLLLGFYADGLIKSWRDVLSPGIVGAVLAASGLKGLTAAGTAKNVEVKR